MKKKFTKAMEYFSPELIEAAERVFKFLIIYTLIFMLLAVGFKYAIPFVIAFIIAILLRPIKKKILSLNRKFKKFKYSEGIVSFVLTFLIVSAIVWGLFILGWKLTEQLKSLYSYLTNEDNLNILLNSSKEKTNNILSSLGKTLTPDIMDKINEGIASAIKLISSGIGVLINGFLSLLVSIPTAFLMIIITIITTFFFTKDIDKIENKIKAMFSEKGLKVLHNLNKKKNAILSGYVKAYTLIMIALFIYCIVSFKIAGIKYAILLAFITAIIDALPLFGAGLIYGFLIISSLVNGDYKKAIILVVGYIGIVIVRQFLEQQLVSSFLGVSPLVIIIGLFIALTPLGFLGMFYFIGGFLIYQGVYSPPKQKNKKVA